MNLIDVSLTTSGLLTCVLALIIYQWETLPCYLILTRQRGKYKILINNLQCSAPYIPACYLPKKLNMITSIIDTAKGKIEYSIIGGGKAILNDQV